MIMVANLGQFQVASVNYNITWICMILNFKVRTKRSSSLRRLYCPTGGTKSLPLYDSEIAQGHSKIMSEFDKFCQCKHGATCWKQYSGLWPRYDCSLDRFTKTFFWNFQSIQADLCYILIYKQMSEKVFSSNIAPSSSSGNRLFYKAEYMGRSCLCQVWAINFDWSALAT